MCSFFLWLLWLYLKRGRHLQRKCREASFGKASHPGFEVELIPISMACEDFVLIFALLKFDQQLSHWSAVFGFEFFRTRPIDMNFIHNVENTLRIKNYIVAKVSELFETENVKFSLKNACIWSFFSLNNSKPFDSSYYSISSP